MQFIIQVSDPAQEATSTLVYTNKRTQKSSKLEVFFIVEEGKQPGWLCKQMPKCRGNSEAALDQVSHAKHSDETTESTSLLTRAIIFILLGFSSCFSVFCSTFAYAVSGE